MKLTVLDTLKAEMVNRFPCPHRDHDKGTAFHCRCNQYHKQTSVRAGTLFQRSHLPLLKRFWRFTLWSR